MSLSEDRSVHSTTEIQDEEAGSGKKASPMEMVEESEYLPLEEEEALEEPGTDIEKQEEFNWDLISNRGSEEIFPGNIFLEEEDTFESQFEKKSSSGSVVPHTSVVRLPSSSETTSLEVRTVEPTVDRNMYYELYALYTRRCEEEKRKNNVLQRKLATHFQTKRMFHVLVTEKAPVSPDNQMKYDELLDELEVLFEESSREREQAKVEIEALKVKRISQKDRLDKLFSGFQKKEEEFIKKLVSSAADENQKTRLEKLGKVLIERQKHRLKQLTDVRLAFILLNNKYNDTLEQLYALDNVGSNYRCSDYELMGRDNRNLKDRLEQLEGMLTSIRKQCQNAVQKVAHFREKISAIEQDIRTEQEQLEGVTLDYQDVREQVNFVKANRAEYRQLTDRMKNKVGLLSKPKFLSDLQDSMGEIEEGKQTLELLKTDVVTSSQLIDGLRRRVLRNQ